MVDVGVDGGLDERQENLAGHLFLLTPDLLEFLSSPLIKLCLPSTTFMMSLRSTQKPAEYSETPLEQCGMLPSEIPYIEMVQSLPNTSLCTSRRQLALSCPCPFCSHTGGEVIYLLLTTNVYELAPLSPGNLSGLSSLRWLDLCFA